MDYDKRVWDSAIGEKLSFIYITLSTTYQIDIKKG